MINGRLDADAADRRDRTGDFPSLAAQWRSRDTAKLAVARTDTRAILRAEYSPRL